MILRHHLIKIATPKLTKNEELVLRGRYEEFDDPALHELARAHSNLQYVCSKVPQIKLTKFNTRTYTIDFILDDCLITNTATEHLVHTIKQLKAARKKLYTKLLPLVVPKLVSSDLEYLQIAMNPAAHTRLRYCLSGCYKVKRDIPSIKFTSIDMNKQIVSFILKDQAYTLPLNKLLSLSLQAVKGA